MRIRHAAMLLPFAVLIACGRNEPEPLPTSTAQSAAPAPAVAQAMLFGASDSSAHGSLDLSAEEGAVMIVGELSGLPPGTEHGFHIHETGDCSAPDASSAGAHLNPSHAQHAGPDAAARHLGDLPNVVADAQGRARVSARIEGATLRDGGPDDLVGKAFVVHDKPDDYVTQPAGDSGDRISCGVVR